MKVLSLLFVLFISIQFHAQKKWIGVPIFNKHLRMEKCQTCAKIKKDDHLKTFYDSIRKNQPEMKGTKYSTQTMIDFYKSLLPKYADSPERSEVIYHALMNLQEDLCEEIDYEAISPSDFNEYNQTIHQLLTLNPNNATHLHQRQMLTYSESSVLDRISKEIFFEDHEKMDNEKWYDINNTDYIESEDWKNLAKQFLVAKENGKGFIPYNRAYKGLNLSYISYANNNTFFHGIESSLDIVNKSATAGWFGNLCEKYFFHNPLSFFGASYVKEYQGNDSEFMFYFYQLRNLLRLNLIQFGIHNHHSMNNNTWFWRPEVGLNLGILNISYAYNFPFNSVGELRGSQLKLGIGFPLIRLGKFII